MARIVDYIPKYKNEIDWFQRNFCNEIPQNYNEKLRNDRSRIVNFENTYFVPESKLESELKPIRIKKCPQRNNVPYQSI